MPVELDEFKLVSFLPELDQEPANPVSEGEKKNA
jgi:hypothetical protein